MFLRFYYWLIRLFWCRRIGHDWSDWKEHRHVNAAMHTRKCSRCKDGEIKEGMTGLITFTMSDPGRLQSIKRAVSSHNLVMEALRRGGALKTLDGGATIEKAIESKGGK